MGRMQSWIGVALTMLLLGVPLLNEAQAQVRPSELNVQFHRAETAWRSGASMLEAKARIDRVLNEIPDDVEALKLRAQVLLKMDRPMDALTDIRKAVALRPRDGEARLILCEAARLTGDLETAEEALAAAAELVSDDAPLHVRLSWNAVLLGYLDRAEAFARIATASDSENTAGQYQLARVFILKDQTEDAVTVLARGLRAAQLDPTVITADTVLIRVADHPDLRSLLNK